MQLSALLLCQLSLDILLRNNATLLHIHSCLLFVTCHLLTLGIPVQHILILQQWR